MSMLDPALSEPLVPRQTLQEGWGGGKSVGLGGYLNLLVDLFEHGRDDKLPLHGLDLLPGGPDVPQEDLLALVVYSCSAQREHKHHINNRTAQPGFCSSNTVPEVPEHFLLYATVWKTMRRGEILYLVCPF